MPEEELDVNKTEESSAEEEELTEDELETEEETEETEDKTEETEEESKEDKSEEAKTEEDPEKLKLKEQVHNLTIALQEKRQKARESVTKPTATQVPVLDTKTYVEAMLKGEEQAAFEEVYKKYPQYAPANDTDNTRYNQLIQDMVTGAKVRGVVPTKKEHFLDLALTALAFRGEKSVETEKAESKGRTEAHKEHLKADAANIGGTNTSARKEQEPSVTEADRRAAQAAGQDIKTYMKYKDTWPKVLEED